MRFLWILLVLAQCLGCASIWDEPIEDEIVTLRKEVLATTREKIGKLSHARTFCCQVRKGFPSWLVESFSYPYRLGVVGIDGALVKPIQSSSHDLAFGERILRSILRCSVDDVVCLGMLRKQEIRWAGLAWFGDGREPFAGIVVLTEDNVYFIYTVMDYVSGNDGPPVYDIFWADPPYYLWRNPYWALYLWKPTGDHVGRMSKKVEKMYRDRESCSDFCFDNFVPAFRIDISPDEFPKVQQD